jgi:hypothetical protein
MIGQKFNIAKSSEHAETEKELDLLNRSLDHFTLQKRNYQAGLAKTAEELELMKVLLDQCQSRDLSY